MKVYTVTPAPPQTAAWLQRLLMPACEAVRLGLPFSVELRPAGMWAGWAAGRQAAPDLRVALTNHVVLYTHRQLVMLYLHESSHQLLHETEPEVEHNHNPAFFSLNMLLLRRLDAVPQGNSRLPAGVASWSDSMSLYDLQDAPGALIGESSSTWRPRALAWALAQAEELAGTELDARACATQISARYAAWCEQLQKERDRREEKLALQAKAHEVHVQAEAKQVVRIVVTACVLAGVVLGTLGAYVARHM